MVTTMLAIVAPMATELAGVRQAIGDPRGKDVLLRVIGMGQQHAETGVAAVASQAPAAIVMVGFCGATDPGLRTGDLHVAEVFYSDDSSDPVIADPVAVNRLRSWTNRRAGRLVGGPSVTVAAIANQKAKSALRAATGAVSVNMEDYWAARASAARGIPFVSIRAVLDTAEDQLPAYLGDPGQGLINVLRGVAAHPRTVPDLIRLARKARVARAALTDCVSGLLDSLPAPSSGVARFAP